MHLKIEWHRGWYFLLMVSPLLPDKLGLFPIYAFILVFILSRRISKPTTTLRKHQKWVLWLAVAFFLFFALSLLWGGDPLFGIKSVEKKLLFLILPALFLLLGRNDRDVGKSVAIFIAFVNLALIICFGIAVYQASIYIGFQAWPFKYYNFTYWIDIHPGYFSLLVLLSLVCTAFMLKEKRGKGKILWIGMIFQSFMLFFIGAKFAILSFLISSVLFLFLFRFKKKQIFLGATVFLALVSLAFFASVNSWHRMASVKEVIADRMELNKVGTDLAAKNWLVGHGAGNVADKLREKFKSSQVEEAYSNNYNIHNQYLQTFLSTGCIGFLLLIALIVLSLRSAENKMFAFLLLLQFVLFFMIESVLVRQKGVVAFVTWVLFISLYNYKNQLGIRDDTD